MKIDKDFTYDYAVFLEHSEHYGYAVEMTKEFQAQGKSILIICDTNGLASNLTKNGFHDFINSEEYVNNFNFSGINYKDELERLSILFGYSQL